LGGGSFVVKERISLWVFRMGDVVFTKGGPFQVKTEMGKEPLGKTGKGDVRTVLEQKGQSKQKLGNGR